MKKKKWLAVLLTIAMVITMIPATVFAEGSGEGDKTVPGWVDDNGGHPKKVQDTFDFVVDDIAYKKVDGGVEVARWYWKWTHSCNQHTETVFAGSEYSGRTTLAIPASVEYEEETYNVIGIGQSAFYEVSGISSIELPEGLLYIGEGAFDFNPNVQINITVPSTVKELKDNCFGAEAVKSVTFSEGSQLTTIGNFVFRGSSISSVDLPDSVTQIGGRVFEACDELTSVTIPANAEFTATPIFGATYQNFSYKGEVNFAEGSKYRYEDGILCDDDTAIEIRTEQNNIVIPEGIKYIADGFRIYDTVDYTSIIESITLPDSLESIGSRAFRECKALKEIVIPENVVEIGSGAFTSCTSLKNVEIKGNVTELNGTFNGCSSLSDLTIPDTVTVIGDYTFSGCSQLTDFDFSNITTIGGEAFSKTGITSVKDAENLTMLSGELAFSECTNLKQVILPEGIQELPVATFVACESIEIMVIPESVTSISAGAFFNSFLNTGATIIFKGTNPPTLGESVFVDNTVVKVIVPAGSEEVYAANDQFKGFITKDDGTTEDNISFKVELPDAMTLCPDKNITLDTVVELPKDAKLAYVSSDNEIATVDDKGNVTGVAKGEATITASIILNDITIASDTCIVTVGHGETELEDTKDATCTEEGYTGDEVCTVCKEIVKKGTSIAKLPHNFEDGKCTVCGAEDPDYVAPVGPSAPVITAGANGVWQIGSSEGLTFTSSAEYDDFQKVQVDGNDLDPANYTAKEGSTIVTLKAEYLRTLSVGKHTLAIVSETGTATTEFTIKAAADSSSQTGDDFNMVLYAGLLILAAAGAAGAVIYGRRKAQ